MIPNRTLAGLCALAAIAMAGCGVARPNYAGSSEPAVGVERVAVWSELPAAHRIIGHANAVCDQTSRPFVGVGLFGSARDVDTQRYSDLACSRELLVAALREQAALSGGQGIVAVQCGKRDVIEDDGVSISRLRCVADVARATSEAATPLAAERASASLRFEPAAPGAPLLGRVWQSWNVLVSFSAAQGSPPRRAPLPPRLIEDKSTLPASHVVLGAATASCDGECDREVMVAALRMTAARVGATDVVGVRCVDSSDGPECIGEIAYPEVDPRIHPTAR